MTKQKNLKPRNKEVRKVTLIHVPKDAENDTIFVNTVGRNEPCPCGSGKKAKSCCQRYKQYYYTPKRKNGSTSINDLGDKL